MSSRLRWCAVGLLAWSLAVVPTGHARDLAFQSPTAKAVLTGTVTDKDGGVIPGATVTVKSLATSIVQTATTNNSGVFVVSPLDAGSYEVTVSLQNFKTVKFDKVVLTPGNTSKLAVTLEIGVMTDVVGVTAAAGVVETTDTTVKSTLNGLQLLPINSNSTHSQRGSTVMGLPQSAISVTIDGVNVQDQLIRLPDGFFVAVRPQTDLVEEVTVPQWTQDGRLIYTRGPLTPADRASYAHIDTNPFYLVSERPLSTFAADVDTASYTNVRRFITQGHLPPADAVRVEEMVNYFRFSYPEPANHRPVSITTEVGDCPWAPTHKLALVGLRAKPIDDRGVQGRNITLLIDVSGSMAPPERLPLIKTALRMFVDTLRDEDQIAIVVYAGASGLALPPTSGGHRQRIHDAIENLSAGGSTNGGEGLRLAYQVARENFVPGGINRVILATDGDFNVGVTSHDDLLALIERERTSGVFLSVLGVGTDNLKDSTMSMLADKGNGHYAYIDSLQEARRVLVREGGATLETVAKDVKLQVEFNPAEVGAYRLLGYEKRLMADRDFNDDKKDGGEMGAGHTVTALYEIVPANADELKAPRASDRPVVDVLKYQQVQPAPSAAAHKGEWLTVKVRYKLPDAGTSEVIEQSLTPGGAAPHLAFASAVAEFGMLLRDDRPLPDRWDGLVKRLKALAGGEILDRASLTELVETAAGLKKLTK